MHGRDRDDTQVCKWPIAVHGRNVAVAVEWSWFGGTAGKMYTCQTGLKYGEKKIKKDVLKTKICTALTKLLNGGRAERKAPALLLRLPHLLTCSGGV